MLPGRDDRQPALSVQFVLDASGSMVWGPESASRFALARRALINSAAQLNDGDYMGLITFSATPSEPLPLARYTDSLAALEAFRPAEPRGGTVLEPALRAGLKRLAESPTEHRLLVLISDGFVEGERLSALQPDIEAAGVDVLALAVGTAPKIGDLTRLTSVNAGRLLYVNNVAELPRLLPEAVARRSRLPVTGPTFPVARAADADGVDWPPLAAHVSSSLAPGGTALLESADGQPLVAHAQRGAGNVLAFAGGLGEWAPQWLNWQALPEQLDVLLRRADAVAGSDGVYAQVRANYETTSVSVDLQTAGGGWQQSSAVPARLFGPDASVSELVLNPTVPGRFVSDLPVRSPGRYLLDIGSGAQAVRHAFYHDRAVDPAASERTTQAVARLERDGLLDTTPTVTRSVAASAWLMGLLALIALALYLSALVLSYYPATLGRALSRLFLRRSSPHATGLQH